MDQLGNSLGQLAVVFKTKVQKRNSGELAEATENAGKYLLIFLTIFINNLSENNETSSRTLLILGSRNDCAIFGHTLALFRTFIKCRRNDRNRETVNR